MTDRPTAARRATGLLVASVLMLAAAACTPPDRLDGAGGTGDPASGATATPTSGGTATGGGPSDPPSGLVECPTRAKDGERAPDDLSGATWTVPSGFAEAAGYVQMTPAEGDHESTYLVLDGTTVDLISVVHYPQLENGPVTDACGVLDLDLVVQRVEAHAEASGSPLTSPPEPVTVAGAPAVVEERSYPDDGFDLRGYWVFGTDELLHVACQWTDHAEEVQAGCDTLVDSLRLP